MNYEESRLRSFENWPTNAAVDARRIAKAGFYYMGQGLEVQCFSCGVRIADWNYGDKVMARHRVLDPGCPFVINPTQSGNVPLVNDSRRIVTSQSDVNSSQRSSLSIPTHSRSGAALVNNQYHSLEARLRSFSNWPIPFIVSPEQLSQSGFFYTQLGDKVQCAYCNVLVERWEPGDEPDIEHVRHFPECPYMNRSSTEVTSPNAGINIRDFNTTDKSGLATLKELGIQSHRVPRHPKFATYESRHQTYCTWPKTLSQKPEDLADAGFFFTGQRDQVRCFHCDGGLKRWEKSDIPWQEHARWFPNCGFLLLVKGQQFVDETLLSHRTILNENGEHLPKPTSVGFTRVRTVTEEELQGLMSTPSAIAALQIGIEASRVKIALRQKMEQTGIPFSSADALIVAALGIQNEENLSQDIDETWATPPDSPILDWSRLSTRRNRTASSSEESERDENELISATSTEEIKTSFDSKTDNIISANSTGESNQTAKLSLEEENRRLKEARLCKICMDNEVSVVFLPCGHLVTCIHCAQSLNDCPLCRQPIKATVRTFLS